MARGPASEGFGVKSKTILLVIPSILFLVTQPVLAVTLVETGCLASSGYSGKEDMKALSEKESFRHAYDEAECLRKAAAAKKVEWLETEKLLNRSLEAADTGEWGKANQLVQKAHFQARTALQQAEHEAEAWKHRVVE